MDKVVLIEPVVIDGILSYAKMLHPTEAILLLLRAHIAVFDRGGKPLKYETV